MFPATPNPNPIQAATFAAADGKELPALVILEAPTGTGKTEASLFLADTWLQKQAGKGIYIAMPSQATSNQMYERVGRFLMGRYPNEAINLHLVHGAALLREEESAQPQSIAQDENSLEGTVKAESWFLPRKRTLLAPFGVGTVDQALLSVLQTRHFFVRMFGLAQKVVVFDEVHAYDTYMSTLFERLLRWLRSIGTSVILLSATLPEQTRRSLVSAWLGAGPANLPPAGYPRLTVVSAGQVETHPLPAPSSRTVLMNWAEPEPQAIAAHLADQLKEGGCAAVICNRVRRAQEIYQVVKDQGIVEPQHLILFHARFPFAWRDEIEKRVLTLFSKGGNRPHKAIVIATQVIEQSLDLDFDYMLTDLAPIDLLLQRAGRLHRHPQNDTNRPSALAEPRLAIARPLIQDELPDFGLDGYIYDKATLLCTWLTLQERENLILPEQTAKLIESVYGENLVTGASENFSRALHGAREKARQVRAKEVHLAEQRLVSTPDDEDLLLRSNEDLEEDNPKVNDAFRALTRLGDSSVSIICLHNTKQGIALELDGSGAPLDLQKYPTMAQSKQFLKRAINVQHREVVIYVLSHDERKSNWKRSAMMREHYPILFDENGEYWSEDANFILKLTPEMGLEVLKKEAK
jgi:CRISPR-associated endonuclease/helicase Cas3